MWILLDHNEDYIWHQDKYEGDDYIKVYKHQVGAVLDASQLDKMAKIDLLTEEIKERLEK